MTSGHFIFIPATILVGVVVGWVLGSRAARDAYAAELRRREEREKVRSRARSVTVTQRQRLLASFQSVREPCRQAGREDAVLGGWMS